MITEKVIQGMQIRVDDVIEFEDLSSNIVVAGPEGDDNIPALWNEISDKHCERRIDEKCKHQD
jgi:hypothetical protein